jgi:hypothetical protein
MKFNEYQKLMNNTKWEEIRLAMHNYPLPIEWRTKDIENSYICDWDSDWFYHFKLDGYKTIEWLEIKVVNDDIKNDIVTLLRKIHVAGEILKDSIKVYGYKKDGFVDYL